ncbi:hypothetical protein ACFL0O_00310 [Thermodesulfobacteriota bacterium]
MKLTPKQRKELAELMKTLAHAKEELANYRKKEDRSEIFETLSEGKVQTIKDMMIDVLEGS